MTYRKKLIEVALPLEEINKASAREKSIRHGHPSTLHLWWARRPLATCRAILFSSIIDDPGEEGVPQELLDEIDKLPAPSSKYNLAAEELLGPNGEPLSGEKAEEARLARERRYKLFTFIEELVQWENTNKPSTLATARKLIQAATNGNPPPVLDPFCGGGSIPIEAQRLGLEAHGSDLNPVAVLITKAMIEIPPKFAGQAPVNSEWQAESAEKKILKSWSGAQGLAEDVRYYGQWVRGEAQKRIGHLYPKVLITEEMAAERPDLKPLVGEELTVIAWLWVRTVPSPDPAAQGAQVPLVRSFVLSSKKGKEAWVEPIVDTATMTYRFQVVLRKPPQDGTYVPRRGGRCVLTNTPMPQDYLRSQMAAKNGGQRLLAIVAEGTRGRVYLSPDSAHERVALTNSPSWRPSQMMPGNPRWFSPPGYGLPTYGDLFTDRQLVALTTFSDLVAEARELVKKDALASGLKEEKAIAYANAITTYLAFVVDKCADYWSSVCSWNAPGEKMRNTFGRQAIPMVWDFAECNPLSASTGNWMAMVDWVWKAIERAPASKHGKVIQADATANTNTPYLFSTDPPYFDNIGYADLSDFFYVWLRRSLEDVYPDLFSTLVTPKTDELIATPYRHKGSKDEATKFFESGLKRVFSRIHEQAILGFPITIYYAYKASETKAIEDEEVGLVVGTETASTGWATMLQGLVDAGLAVNGTWPLRTELGNRMIAMDTNALSSSIVLVCRPRAKNAETIRRSQLVIQLRQELKPALMKLTQGNIAPVDLEQAMIGPGMAVFSRYAAVLESNGNPMSVRSALALINEILDSILEEQEGWYDKRTRWAVKWFSQYGFQEGPYGEAEVMSTANDTPVGTLVEAGIVKSGKGKVKLLSRQELPADYDPANDERATIWEATQYLVRELDNNGELGAARMMRRFREARPDIDIERARELSYRLYVICDQKRWTNEARGYNALVMSWSDIKQVSESEEAAWRNVSSSAKDKHGRQASLNPKLEGMDD